MTRLLAHVSAALVALPPAASAQGLLGRLLGGAPTVYASGLARAA